MTQHVDEVTPAIRWYFAGGLGVALVSMALIGVTHRGLDPTGTSRIGRVSPKFQLLETQLIIY